MLRVNQVTDMRSFVALLVTALTVGTGCAPGEGGGYEALVFPKEARLGASAAIVIDSNYTVLFDDNEAYDLHKNNVRVLIEDDLGARVEANVRDVFDLSPASWSRATADVSGAWFTVALFDLPTSGLDFTGSPQIANVIVEIDGVEDPFRAGRIEITGPGGTPTSIPFPGPLESSSLLRLRAVRADGGNPGFDDSWTIGAMQFDVKFSSCLEEARFYTDSEAAGAAVHARVRAGAFLQKIAHVLLVDPQGFSLKRPSNAAGLGSPTSAGEGPFVTIAFERHPDPLCYDVLPTLEGSFRVENLYVTDLDGATLIDRRGQGSSEDLVELIVVDTETAI